MGADHPVHSFPPASRELRLPPPPPAEAEKRRSSPPPSALMRRPCDGLLSADPAGCACSNPLPCVAEGRRIRTDRESAEQQSISARVAVLPAGTAIFATAPPPSAAEAVAAEAAAEAVPAPPLAPWAIALGPIWSSRSHGSADTICSDGSSAQTTSEPPLRGGGATSFFGAAAALRCRPIRRCNEWRGCGEPSSSSLSDGTKARRPAAAPIAPPPLGVRLLRRRRLRARRPRKRDCTTVAAA